MRHEIAIDNIILTCDIHSYIKKSPDFNTLDSDWDARGYEELDFTVESALELDEDGLPFDLSSTEIDKLMADEWFVKLMQERLKKEILKIIEAEKENE
jgi:hypothetical protein